MDDAKYVTGPILRGLRALFLAKPGRLTQCYKYALHPLAKTPTMRGVQPPMRSYSMLKSSLLWCSLALAGSPLLAQTLPSAGRDRGPGSGQSQSQSQPTLVPAPMDDANRQRSSLRSALASQQSSGVAAQIDAVDMRRLTLQERTVLREQLRQQGR